MKPQAKEKPAENPGVDVGDEVYINHVKGPCAGKVVAHGAHGATVDVDGTRHKVGWKHVLGAKKRAAQHYNVIDEGEDGMIVEDAAGMRRYITVAPEAREDKMVVKAFGGNRLVLFAKANGPMANRPGLAKKQITDKTGRQQTKWVRSNPDQPKQLKAGHHVGFENGEHKGHGEVTAVGEHGATVRDGADGVHRVPHSAITHHWEGEGAPDQSPHEEPQQQKPEVKAHEGDPDSFSAEDFARQHDDPNATADSIVDGFGGDARARIDKARERVGGVKQTIDEHTDSDGEWNEQRAALHRKILFEGVEVNGKKVPGLLDPARIKAATPPKGEKPTFIALGGRGGSGKSSLNGRVYDEAHAIVLDADHIKGMLPEYEGWNAHQVHEESSAVLDTVLRMAKLMRVNIVLDATMKTGKSIEDKVDDFKSSGFRIESHYMHLPRQEAAKRAVGRFLNGGEKGRYVPPEVVLGNDKNESNFDKIKAKSDAWSFHDNSGEKGAGPKLIASKGEAATVPKKVMLKSLQTVILFMSKGGHHG